MLEAYEQQPDAFTSSVSERAGLPLSWWASRLKTGAAATEQVLGAFRNVQLSGVVGVSFQAREKIQHKATVFGMYVPSQWRRQGIGQQLIQAALAQARRRPGVRVTQLTVTQGNRTALALYQRNGFVQFGLEPFAVAVGHSFISKIHMWCDLEVNHDGQAGTWTVNASGSVD
jgi:ribosomal protein S18 acetylase RimI-like enzyme